LLGAKRDEQDLIFVMVDLSAERVLEFLEMQIVKGAFKYGVLNAGTERFTRFGDMAKALRIGDIV